MPSVSGAIPPFHAGYQPGYTPTGSGATGTAGAGGATGGVADIIDVRAPRPGGSFTAEAGDRFALFDLFKTGGAYDSVAGYRVALRSDPATPAGGRLLLNGEDVTGRIDFSPLEFIGLTYEAGPDGARQDIVVVARSGTPQLGGGLANIVDSPAVQITAAVTGTRSINAAAALRTTPGADEADVLRVARDANIYSGLAGGKRPALSTVGNFTAEAGDRFALFDLFKTGGAYDSVAGYRVALRSDPATPAGGRLMLNGEDVTSRIDFSPLEFIGLTYEAGPDGARQDIVVVARNGTPQPGGGLTNIVDSQAVQITAEVTGTRSINAAAALRTTPGADEADVLRIVRDANIYTGLASGKRPALSTAGNFTGEAGDRFALFDLFKTGGAYDSVAGYRVALRSDPAAPAGGRLMLNGEDVTSRIDFSPLEFIGLTYEAGPDGARQDIVVVARNGTPQPGGGLANIVDSPAVQITAEVTGTRSINAAAALRTTPGADEADVLRIVRDANIYSGLASGKRPALSTAGNFTAEAGDRFALFDLFKTGGAYDSVAGYRVALRSDPAAPAGGRLMLNGEDVTSRLDFSPLEFIGLTYEAGPDGARQDIVVVARNGTPQPGGGLTNIVDSQAVQITAEVTGTRSINAAAALRTMPGADEADVLRVVRDANIYTGLASGKRPALSTVGNFTAEAGDRFALFDLYRTGGAYDSVAGYRVALRSDPAAPAGGRLMLNGEDVTSRLDFSPLEFIGLTYEAGPDGARQDIVVVARSGTPQPGGGLTNIVDSPAVQITAEITGTRSINAAAALRTTPGVDEADVLRVVRDAGIYSGLASGKRPTLTSVGQAEAPSTPLAALSGAVGAFNAAGGSDGPSRDLAELAALYGGAIGASRSTAPTAVNPDIAALALLLDADAIGGARSAGDQRTRQTVALLAYRRTT